MITNSHADSLMRKIEELSLNSWPSLKTIYYDGWIVRFAGRVTNRSNSVWSLHPSTLDIESKVSACEAFYAGQGQPAVFRIASEGDVPPLNEVLDKRRYTVITPTSVQTMSLDSIPAEIDSDIAVETALSDTWFDSKYDLLDTSEEKKQTYRMILESIALPCCFAAIHRDGKPVAVGIAVCEQGWVGVYGMFTDTAHRGRGLGRQMLNGLLSWGRGIGASKAYLHVEADNAVARRLYERMGFREVYQYWYRVQSTPRKI